MGSLAGRYGTPAIADGVCLVTMGSGVSAQQKGGGDYQSAYGYYQQPDLEGEDEWELIRRLRGQLDQQSDLAQQIELNANLG